MELRYASERGDKILLLREINSRAARKFKTPTWPNSTAGEKRIMRKTSKGFLNITAIYLISSFAAAAATAARCRLFFFGSNTNFSEAEKSAKRVRWGKFSAFSFAKPVKATNSFISGICKVSGWEFIFVAQL